ncbi:hypothetical protein D3C86_1957450 [compost metagenome]
MGRQIKRRQQANYPAADNHHLLLLGHHLIQPLRRQRAQRAPEEGTQRPQQSLLVNPSAALLMPITPVLVSVKSPHLSVAMLASALRTAVSRKAWSVKVAVIL